MGEVKQALVIYKVDFDKEENVGVASKMNAQVNAFEQLGFEVDTIFHKSQKIYFNDQHIGTLKMQNALGKFVFTFSYFFKVLLNKIDLEQYKFIYIRYPFASNSFIKFLQETSNTKAKTLLEFPTYPYDDELKAVSKFSLAIDRHYRQSLNKYVDLAVHFGSEKEVYSIPTIRTSNGVESSVLERISDLKKHPTDGVIRIVFVGKLHYWHGLDRVINGLKNEDDFEFNIVGNGPELNNIKKLVDTRDLTDKFNFHGVKTDVGLLNILSKSDIGIGTLGIHRKGLNYNSSLKHRLYTTAGLPFIFSTDDSDFPSKLDFTRIYTADNSIIGISELTTFLKSVSSSKDEIMKYAQNNLTWVARMKTVIDKLMQKPNER